MKTNQSSAHLPHASVPSKMRANETMTKAFALIADRRRSPQRQLYEPVVVTLYGLNRNAPYRIDREHYATNPALSNATAAVARRKAIKIGGTAYLTPFSVVVSGMAIRSQAKRNAMARRHK